MITFKPIIIQSNRRKDGTFAVKIRVTFKGVSRRLPTTLSCSQSDLTRSGHIKNPNTLNKANAIIADMREAVNHLSPFDLEIQDVDWVVNRIKQHLTKSSFRLDFFVWCESFLRTKSDTTAAMYRVAVNSFRRFLGKDKIDINDITRSLVVKYQEWSVTSEKTNYLGEPIKGSVKKGSTDYVGKLHHLHEAAKRKYNDEDEGVFLIPRSPFRIERKLAPNDGQKSLGRDLMQRIISYKTDDKKIRTALDAFVVSFALMGANLADMYAAMPPRSGVWVYQRQKTRTRRADKAEMRVAVPSCIEPYLARLRGTGSYWLNNLRELSTNKNQVIAQVNMGLRRWCELEGVERFTFYAARHSFATIARNDCGIEKATIDDCLAHKGDYAVADIYAERSWSLMNAANEKVLALFAW